MDQLNMQAAFEVGRVVHLFFAPAFFQDHHGPQRLWLVDAKDAKTLQA